MIKRLFSPTTVGLVAVLSAGCAESDLGRVAGRVTLDGKPLAGALIEFHAKSGQSPSLGITDRNGRYYLTYNSTTPGALVGPHRVRITTASDEIDPNGIRTAIPERVPDRYNTQTTLFAEVEPGQNEIDFVLYSTEISQTAH